MVELKANLDRIKSLPQVVYPSTTIELPAVLDETRYSGFSLADVLEPVGAIPQNVAVELYEQLVWLKFKEKLSPPVQALLFKQIDRYLGVPISRLIQSDRDNCRSVVLYLWGIAKSLGLPLHLSGHNAHIELNGVTLGFVSSQLVSRYVTDVRVSRNLLSSMSQPRKMVIRRNPMFSALYAASKHNREINGLLILAIVLAGSRCVLNLKPNLGRRPLPRDRVVKLWKNCVQVIWDESIDPVPALKLLLVPIILTVGTFNAIFKPSRDGRPPGKVRRRRLERAINTVFGIEGKNEKTTDRHLGQEEHGQGHGR